VITHCIDCGAPLARPHPRRKRCPECQRRATARAKDEYLARRKTGKRAGKVVCAEVDSMVFCW
jgi:uncharacterized Zn finger protein (UPF0148 family)